MAAPVAMTELEAVNVMLSAIGESPIADFTTTAARVDVQLARSILVEVSREFQARGWNFNTEEQFPLTPDATYGYIYLPASCMSVSLDPFYYPRSTYRVTQRGARLYDRKNHTFVFSKALKATVIFALDFTDLTTPARQYIVVRAARIFGNRLIGSTTLDGFSERDEETALGLFEEDDGRDAQHNIFDSPDVGAAIYRRGDFVWP